MKGLKIIHCLVFYLPVRIGGIEVYVQALLRELKNKGHEVKILVPDYKGEKTYPLELNEIPILTYPEFSNLSRKEFRGDIPGKGLKGFIKCLENEKADIVHFHQLTSSNGISIFHLQAAKETGAKVVYTNHLAGLTCATGRMRYKNESFCNGIMDPIKCSICQINNLPNLETFDSGVKGGVKSVLPYLKNSGIRYLKFLTDINNIKNKKSKVAALIATADKFIVLTKWYYKVLEKNNLLNEKVKLIRQGLPGYPINDNNKASFASDSPLRLIYVGRIFPDKGLHILLEAIRTLNSEKFTLDIFGQLDGEDYFKKCKRIIKDSKNINWFSFIPNANIINTIKNYDLLVLPSVVSEMAPLVLLESNAAGVPVVGTNIGGIAEEIENGYNGWLFEMGDVNGLKKIISDILKEPSILLEVSSQLSKVRSFKEVADEVEAVYFSLL